MTRGTGADGDMIVIPEEATVYTNIVPATPRKLTYGGDVDENTGGAVPAPTAASPIELDAGQGDDASLNEVQWLIWLGHLREQSTAFPVRLRVPLTSPIAQKL